MTSPNSSPSAQTSEPAHQQRSAVDHAAQEIDGRQIGKHQIGFPTRLGRRRAAASGWAASATAPGAADHQGQQHNRDDQASKASLQRHSHLSFSYQLSAVWISFQLDRHKTPDYTRKSFTRSSPRQARILGGSAIPPVKKILTPSSTVMSGNVARSRSQITMSPRYRLLVGT